MVAGYVANHRKMGLLQMKLWPLRCYRDTIAVADRNLKPCMLRYNNGDLEPSLYNLKQNFVELNKLYNRMHL